MVEKGGGSITIIARVTLKRLLYIHACWSMKLSLSIQHTATLHRLWALRDFSALQQLPQLAITTLFTLINLRTANIDFSWCFRKIPLAVWLHRNPTGAAALISDFLLSDCLTQKGSKCQIKVRHSADNKKLEKAGRNERTLFFPFFKNRW